MHFTSEDPTTAAPISPLTVLEINEQDAWTAFDDHRLAMWRRADAWLMARHRFRKAQSREGRDVR